MAVMRRTIIGVPLYRRSRPQGVSGAGPVEKQVITRLESHRTASHLHRHPAQKIFIGTQNGKFLESFPSGHTIATHTHTHIYKKITIIHTYSYLNELFIYICDICDISHTSRKGENSNTNSKSPQQLYNDFRQTKPSVKPSYTTFYQTQV